MPDEEYLQGALMGYTGSDPILRAAKRAALGEKALQEEGANLRGEAGAVEELQEVYAAETRSVARAIRQASQSEGLTGDEPDEVIARGRRKGITKVDK